MPSRVPGDHVTGSSNARGGIRQVLRREQPALVIGTGGYVCGPVLWAAMEWGIPGVLQEQNAFPGIATRYTPKI